MYNYVMLIGTVTNISDLSTEFDTSIRYVTLELNDPYFCIPTKFDVIASDTMTEELRKGAKVAIKGRLYPDSDSIQIIAERIMFISNKEE